MSTVYKHIVGDNRDHGCTSNKGIHSNHSSTKHMIIALLHFPLLLVIPITFQSFVASKKNIAVSVEM